MQEINFWGDLNRALLGAQTKLESAEVAITLAVLKRAKRFLATMTFDADHGLGTALKRVESVMGLMKDFPIDAILSSTDISQLNQGATVVFTHLKKIRGADEYKLARLLHLVEVISSDVAQQVISLLRVYSLIQVSYEQFEQLMSSCKELFANWHRQLSSLYEIVKELSKRRGSMNTDKIPLLMELQLEHTAIEERIAELGEFREQHEKLRDVIHRVVDSGSTANGAAEVRGEITGDAIVEINAAYAQLNTIDPLDVSVEGTVAWKNVRKTYDLCIDRIEGRIISSLTSRLSATSNADEMFRVFSKYNALFFRPRIRSAVQQFQMQLIENVKEDVSNLQEKFKAHYAYSEASRTSKLRDIPPIAGAVMWAKQIERKLKVLLSRVESVLGVGWEQHVEGRALKNSTEAFIAKLNPQLIFDQWVNELASTPIFDIKSIILNIVTEDTPQGERKKIVVAFNQQIVTLFKEVRNLEWLGYRVPFTIKMTAEDAKSRYPFAMSLDASIKTYTTSCRRIQPIFEPLVAAYVREVRATIGKTFTKGNEIRWHADSLSSYVTDLATKVERLHEKVEDLLQKNTDIQQLLDGVRSNQEFKLAETQEALTSTQRIVDDLSLAGYANLNVFVKNLNGLISTILGKNLELALQRWIACFSSHSDEKAYQAALTVAGVEVSTHQILLKNQVLYLEPSVNDARSQWLSQLQALLNSICNLSKIQTSSYENVYGKVGGPLSALSSPPRKSASARRRETVFVEALNEIPQDLLLKAYSLIDSTVREVERYASTWLQYQALWDMDAQTAINSVGEDLQKWQQILMEIKNERNAFDAVLNTKKFGPMVVNYQQIQAQVNVKYDAWHNEFLSYFGDLLCKQINEFYDTISSKRSLLEQHALEAATAQVVAAVTLIQEMRVMRVQWQEAVVSFSEGERLLKKQRFRFPSNWPSLANVEGEWEAFTQLLERKSTAMESQLPQLQAKILEEKSTLDSKVIKAVAEWDEAKPLQGSQVPKVATELLMIYETRFNLLRAEQEKMAAALDALNVSFVAGVSSSIEDDRSSRLSLARAIEELGGLQEVWKHISSAYAHVEELQDTPWTAVQPRKIRKQLDEIVDEMRRFPARVQQYEAFEHFSAAIQSKRGMNSLLAELRSDAMRDRHWKQILQLLRINLPFTELTLRNFWESKLAAVDNDLKSIIRTAQGEMALDEFLRQVADYWTNYQLELVNYQNRCRIIRGWDEMFAKLEEHMNSLNSMKQSPYYRVFAELASSWEDKLTKIRGILDIWIDVQRRWVYLEGIFFGSADIKQQLPREFSRFQSIDSEFTATMKRAAHKPMVVEVASIPNLAHSLERQQDMMGNVQRALGEYLERQRAAFPRFYFVGDEDLLEMIGNSKEPKQIQRHLSKMFAGISSLEIDSSTNTIAGMVSREGEVVRFKQPVATAEDTRINIWLGRVEDQMRQTLSLLLEEAVRSHPAEGNVDLYLNWVADFPAQVVILATQIQWSRDIEKALKAGGDLGAILRQLDAELLILSERVLSDVKNDVRKKYEQLITEVVHQKSVTKRLSDSKVSSIEDFRWLYHMRHYFNAAESDPLKKLAIKVSNATFQYGFEYLGVGERLVQTPLTERCYLTLTQALDFGMGGNPFGPAGTGKTESVKALGSQLGRFVLVFNCDENFDFQAMGRIFVGLCQVGAWGCFDEFNRLEERVLSAVSQQILAIQSGVSSLKGSKTLEVVSKASPTAKSGAITIELLGKSVKLHPDVGIFVTMNPGYAGRSNLPDNLKQLFRSIAMVAPDRELIAQVMLFSQGITTAEQISAKVVLLFNLCEDQLSKQPHYDFGLRALKSVLVSAGQLKRKLALGHSNGEAPVMAELETRALISSISDTILPKLVAQDVPVFETLLKGVFPGTQPQLVEEDELRAKIIELAKMKKLVPNQRWVEKALQLYQVMTLRHGVMLVGPSGSGKSSAWRVLLEALEQVDGTKGDAHVIDPKSLSKEHLYGVLDNTTLEWTDGVFTHTLRQVLNSVRGESERRHWIIFDGDVDPEWAENLNSVLDDNRLLTLPSGERLEIPPNVWVMMETETLRYATLATVSRCGMVWFSDDTVQTSHIVDHYLQKIRDEVLTLSSFTLQPSESELSKRTAHSYVTVVRDLLDRGDGMPSHVELCLEQAMCLPHIMEVTSLRLLMSMFSLVGRGLSKINEYNESHQDFPMSEDQISRFTSKWLAFSIIWGFGGSMDSVNRAKLCDFVVQALESRMTFPVSSPSASPENTLLEYEVNVDDGEWRQWSRSIPQLDLESHRVLSTDVVVTTVDTVRHVEVLRGWLSQHRPLILCGPPGSGKTMTLTSTLNSLPEFELASLNFSSGTSPELILKTFSQYCEYKRTPSGMVLAPNSPEKWLVVFCDEINLPETDAYGTQRVITFLRQLVEQEGFWLGGKNVWVRLQRIQFVGACNPPTDPGRVPLSLRLLRHAPVMLVDFPSYPSLKQIYGTFNRALLKLTPTLKSYVQPLTDAMVDVYHRNQTHFTAEMQPHYIYSPRELSRWMRALYEAIEPLEYEIEIETLVKLVFHEALRLFMDRLVTADEQKWCFQTSKEILRHHFPQSATALEVADYGGKSPVLFSTWLSKNYTESSTVELRKHIEARLRVFYEEELNVQLVVFDSVIDHVLRIDRVLRQPLGHLLLVGESGAGKTVLSRFVSWMNGMAVFQIKLTSNYTLDNFDDDLRVVLKRAGCDGEKICFIFDESNVLNSAFLERMNALLASGEVPGLFEDDEYTSLMHACREAVQRDGVMVENTEDELFRYFTKQVQRNLHVVFTMNPASGDFQNRTNTSPALFNRCVVDWFGTWNNHALAQVAYEFTNTLDLPSSVDFIVPSSAETALASVMPHFSASSFRDVLVGSIVQFHHAVLVHMRRLQKRHMKYNHISPRDYLEFIRHFVSLYSEKRAQLEDQQLHLNVGVQKLQATHEQVAELQAQLSVKERELKKKDVEANEKLQQMILEQNEAQEKKKDTETLAVDLSARDEEINSRKKVVEADLAQAEPALLDAQASVNSIRKSQLDEIRALARPPAAVRMTVEAVAVMLGETSLEWSDLRRFIRRDDFISMVVNFDSNKLTAKQRHTIQTNYVENAEEFEYEKVNRASKACGPLYKWVVSQLNYTAILHRIKPLRDEVQNLVEQSADLRSRYEEAKATIDALEVRIANYKHEYAELINEAQLIKNDMSLVSKKVQRSVALLESLLQESERWEAGANDFEAQMSTLVGDTMLCAAFLTYVGFLDFQQRRILVQDWRDILESMGIHFKPQLSFVDYLSQPNQQLEWQMSDLPADELCYENAIILQRFHRFPLIIDPSGQANTFIMKHYALKTNNSKITQTSFLDASFMKVLASAIRFGTALLVHEVENIDPILNPVLNRELYKTGGRVLIRLGGEEIDYSPDFKLFLITRDPSCRFSPDICSRVTFVNFTVTPSSLESQALSIFLKQEQPEAEEKRNGLLKLQGEYQAKLRELEDALLQQINNVQGNILDDDRVINALESMKAEAAHITKQVDETQATMALVEKATSRYRPLAKASSRLFFALESLAAVRSLYQYSLSFFLALLAQVLALPHEASGDESQAARIGQLSRELFAQVAMRVSRGLEEGDKLMFALRQSQIYLELLQENTAAMDAAAKPFDAPSDEEMDILLGSATTFLRADVGGVRDTMAQLLTRFSKSQIDQLAKLAQLPLFNHVEAHVRANAPSWDAFVASTTPEVHLPSDWDGAIVSSTEFPRRTAFRSAIAVQFVRPDRVMFALEHFVSLVFGAEFPWRGESDFRADIERDTVATRGVLLCSTTGFDASAQIDELAATLRKKYASVSMGSAEGFDAAEKALHTAMKSGSWLLLRNVHLCPSWLAGLEKKLYNARDSVNPGFRLFLTSQLRATPPLPVNLVRGCDVFVFEAPSGMKRSMLRSLEAVPAERMHRAPAERARLYLLLAWFHALVHERLRYVPVGWSKAYEFSQSDFRGACDVIDRWVDAVAIGRAHVPPDNIPWAAIRTTLQESVYGGRVDNSFDETLLATLLAQVFTPESYEATFALVSGSSVECETTEEVTIAGGKTKAQFVDWVRELPTTNPPSWMGLPRSAEQRRLMNEGATTLRNLHALQDAYGGEEGTEQEEEQENKSAADVQPAWVKQLARRVEAWIELLPASLPSVASGADAYAQHPALADPVFRCVSREVELGSSYLSTVKNLLESVRDVCANTRKPTADVREAMRELRRDQLPSVWNVLYATHASQSLGEWLNDFARRINQLDQMAHVLVTSIASPSSVSLLTSIHRRLGGGVWLGGLFSPEALVTAARQSVAASRHCSLDVLRLVAQIVTDTDDNMSGEEDVGAVCARGVQLEGAEWTSTGFAPSDELRNDLPLVRLCWVAPGDDADVAMDGSSVVTQQLPVYRSSRRDALVFSVAVDVNAAQFPTTKWVQRSVALALWQLEA